MIIAHGDFCLGFDESITTFRKCRENSLKSYADVYPCLCGNMGLTKNMFFKNGRSEVWNLNHPILPMKNVPSKGSRVTLKTPKGVGRP